MYDSGAVSKIISFTGSLRNASNMKADVTESNLSEGIEICRK